MTLWELIILHIFEIPSSCRPEILKILFVAPHPVKSLQKCPEMSRNVKKSQELSRNVQKCPQMSTNVQKRPEMCRNVQKCAYVIHGCPLQSRCHEEVLYTRLNRSCSINSAASFPPANNTAASTSASSSVSTCLAAAASADAAVAASMEAAAETPNNFTQQHKGSFYSGSTIFHKVLIFWEGRKNLRNLHCCRFVLYSNGLILWPSQNIWALSPSWSKSK